MDFADHQAIVGILHRYFWLVDHGRAAEIVSLFSPDGQLTFGLGSPQPGTLTYEDLKAAMAARQAQKTITTRHVVSNIAVTPTGNNTASVYSILTLYRADSDVRDSSPTFVADIEDSLTRYDGNWTIQRRTITPIFTKVV